MDAIFAGNFIGFLPFPRIFVRCKDLSLIHRPENIGEGDVLFDGHLERDIAQGAEVDIVFIQGTTRVLTQVAILPRIQATRGWDERLLFETMDDL